MPATLGSYLEPDSAFDPVKADYPSCPDAINLLFDPALGAMTGSASLDQNPDNPKNLITVRADQAPNTTIHRYDILFPPSALNDYKNHLELKADVPSSGDTVPVTITCQKVGAFTVLTIENA
jgi:hypothetical protein